MSLSHQYVADLFSNLANNQSDQFFAKVAPNVHWEVEGTHPLAGNYQSKEEFLAHTFKRLDHVLQQGVILKVNHIFIDGDVAIVEMTSLSTAIDNQPFDNHYCWVVKFNDDMIIDVRAYLDSALVKSLIMRCEK